MSKIVFRKIDGKTFASLQKSYDKRTAKKIAEEYRTGTRIGSHSGKPIGTKANARVIKEKKGYRVFIRNIPRN